MKSGTFKLLLMLFAGGAALTALLFASPRDLQPQVAIVERPTPQHPVEIRPTKGTPKVLTTLTNHAGATALVSCSSCHATTKPDRTTRSASQLDKFHQGMKFDHGDQSCLNCHNESDYDTLKLANGSAVEYSQVMQLCGQCHGPQLRDYQMGLHGGMNGHWDLTRGPRTRNSCTHCHDPHAPAYPTVKPVLPPKDRIAIPHSSSH